MGVSDVGELHDGNPPPCSRLPCCVCPSPSSQPVEEGAIEQQRQHSSRAAHSSCVCVPWHSDA